MAFNDEAQPGEGLDMVNIDTRRSQLAIAQVNMIVAQLQAAAPGPQYRSQVVSTMADENQVKSFQAFDSKSMWTERMSNSLCNLEAELSMVFVFMMVTRDSGLTYAKIDGLG